MLMWKVHNGKLHMYPILQDKLRMETLRCRAYTRQRLREQGREVEEMEGRVLDAQQQLTAVNRENRRYMGDRLITIVSMLKIWR